MAGAWLILKLPESIQLVQQLISQIFIFFTWYFPPSHLSTFFPHFQCRSAAVPQVDDRGGVGWGGHGAQAPHGQLRTSAGESQRWSFCALEILEIYGKCGKRQMPGCKYGEIWIYRHRIGIWHLYLYLYLSVSISLSLSLYLSISISLSIYIYMCLRSYIIVYA